jgi:glycosyltransferase involved in cell wall biosynthesis
METEMSKPHYPIETRSNAFELNAAAGFSSAAHPAQTQTARRVLFIAYQFAPSLEMGALSCVQIARHLPLHGWSPVVLTAQERYTEERYRGRDQNASDLGLPDAFVRTGVLPHPFDFYRGLLSALRPKPQDNGDGSAAAHAEVDSPLNEKGGLRRLILSVLSTPDMHTGWIVPAILAGLKAVRRSQAQQLFSSAPFWTNHLVGLALSYLTGLQWTAHFRDPWVAGNWQTPSSAVSHWLNKRLEKMIVTRATAVVSVTEEHSAAFRQTYAHLPAGKFVTIPNGYDNGEWDSLPADIPRDETSEGKFLITYTGAFYVQRDPQPVFRALKALLDSGEAAPEQVQIDLIGWCETSEGRSVKEMAVSSGVEDCVNILGPRSRQETLRRICQSDLLLLLAEKFVIQIPGKTYEYLRAGRPILALTPEGALANLLRKIGGGWAVHPADDAGILAALRQSFQHWKQGRVARVADPAVVGGFDRRVLAGRLAELFDRLN